MPAAAWAARSGDAVLLMKQEQPAGDGRQGAKQHEKPHIYLLGPETVISMGHRALEKRKLGKVRRIQGANPVENAIAFARYKKGGFGWGAVVPGQNLTIANTTRPARRRGRGRARHARLFAPLLLTDNAAAAAQLESYLLDVQPGFEGDPCQGVYNHVWILGGADAISPRPAGRSRPRPLSVPVDAPQTAAPR